MIYTYEEIPIEQINPGDHLDRGLNGRQLLVESIDDDASLSCTFRTTTIRYDNGSYSKIQPGTLVTRVTISHETMAFTRD